MRIARIGLVGALLLGAAACQTDDGGAVATNVPPLAFVRYINAVPDTNNLTLRWVDQLDFSPQTFVNVAYRGLGQGGYQGLEAGSRHFRVFTHDPALSGNVGGAVTAQLADTTFTFVAGQYYTLLHLGYARTGQTPAQRVYILNDALPAASNSVALRVVHAAPGAGAVDVFATAAAPTSLVGVAPTFANVAPNTSSAYATRATGAFAAQIAATGTTSAFAGALAPDGVAGSTTADPIAGATVGGSVLTAIAFLPAVAGSPAAGLTFVESTGRSIDTVFAVGANFQLNDVAATSWAVNRFAVTPNSTWDLRIIPAACPTVTAPTTAKCETRPATPVARIISNTANTLTTSTSLAAFPRAYYFDTLKTPGATGRIVDTVYAVAGGFELRDSVATPWTVNQFAQRPDTSWIVTITPPACPTVVAPVTVVCATRPAAITVRLTGNGTNTLVTASNLAAYAQSRYADVFTNPNSNPTVTTVLSARTTFAITRDVAVRSARSTYSVTGNNPPAIVWFSDRQPARTTTP